MIPSSSSSSNPHHYQQYYPFHHHHHQFSSSTNHHHQQQPQTGYYFDRRTLSIISSSDDEGENERAVTNDFDDFRFCGEGMANFVISARHKRTDRRVVWRFRKDKKRRIVSNVNRAVEDEAFIRRQIAPLIGRKYVYIPRVIPFRAADVFRVSTVPELAEYFPRPQYEEFSPIQCLEMPDFTSMPPSSSQTSSVICDAVVEGDASAGGPNGFTNPYPTITVEIKPKQAIKYPELGEGDPCYNCLSQFIKWKSGRYSTMYDFCSLQLFSGDLTDVTAALSNLIEIPHNNLKISVNGELVHCEDFPLNPRQLESILFPPSSMERTPTEIELNSERGSNGDGYCSIEDFTELIARIITGSIDQKEEFGIRRGSIFGRLAELQFNDILGISGAYELYQKLSEFEKRELKNPHFLFRPDIVSRLSQTLSPLEIKRLQQHSIGNTVRDCSVLITLRQLSPDHETDRNRSESLVVHPSLPTEHSTSTKIGNKNEENPVIKSNVIINSSNTSLLVSRDDCCSTSATIDEEMDKITELLIKSDAHDVSETQSGHPNNFWSSLIRQEETITQSSPSESEKLGDDLGVGLLSTMKEKRTFAAAAAAAAAVDHSQHSQKLDIQNSCGTASTSSPSASAASATGRTRIMKFRDHSGRLRTFEYRVAVVDLDAKEVKRVEKKCLGLYDALKDWSDHEREFGPLSRPCRRLKPNQTLMNQLKN